MSRDRIRHLVAYSCLLVIVACGGSGGGSSAGSNTSGNNPPPGSPPNSEPVPLTTSNAKLAMFELGEALDSTVALAINVQNHLAALISDASVGSTNYCDPPISGSPNTYTTSYDDNDGSGAVSGGDTFYVDYAADCFLDSLDEYIRGRAVFHVDELVLGNDTGLHVVGRVAVNDLHTWRYDDQSNMTGELYVEAFATSNFERLEVAIPAGESITYTWAEDSDPMTYTSEVEDLHVFREKMFSSAVGPSTEFTYQARIYADSLGGYIDCGTHPSMNVAPYSNPESDKEFECRGANSSRSVGRVKTGLFGRRTLEVYADPGTGVLAAAGLDDLAAFKLHTLGKGLAMQRFVWNTNVFGQASYTPLAIRVDASAHDRVSGRLYVVDAGELVVYDDASIVEIDRVALPEPADQIALSDDGSTLWLAASGSPVLFARDAHSLAAITSFAFTSPGTDRFVSRLAVVPGTTDHLVAVLRHRREVVYFNAGTELASSISIVDTFDTEFVVADASTLVVSDAHAAVGNVLRIASLDPVSGIDDVSSLTGYANADGGGTMAFGKLFLRSGRVIDIESEAISGNLPDFNPGRTFEGLIAVAAEDRIFATYGNLMVIYEASTNRAIAAYKLTDFYLGEFRGIYVTDASVIVAFDEQVIQVNRADLDDSYDLSLCNTIDNSGLLRPGLAVTLNCHVSDAVYDSIRDKLIISTRGTNGEHGLSIAVVEPTTGQIETLIPVGIEVSKMRIADDNQSLLLASPDADQLLVVDLQTRQVSKGRPLGLVPDPSGLFLPVPALAIAVEPLSGVFADYAVTFEGGGAALYSNDVQLPNVHHGVGPYADIFASVDEQTMIATRIGWSSALRADATGLANLADLGDIFYGSAIKLINIAQLGDELFHWSGDIYDIQTGSLSTPCVLDNRYVQSQVVIPGDQEITYVGDHGTEFWIRVCDRATGTVSPTKSIHRFGNHGFDLVGAFTHSSGVLMIVAIEGVTFVNPNDS